MPERSHLSIGEVLSLLREEFPDVTISKIRFLESQGLVDPERTPSGYRKFYDQDVERLRWILRQQREHFLPLKVIRGRLSEGAAGEANGTEAHPSHTSRQEPADRPETPHLPGLGPSGAPDEPSEPAAPQGERSEVLTPHSAADHEALASARGETPAAAPRTTPPPSRLPAEPSEQRSPEPSRVQQPAVVAPRNSEPAAAGGTAPRNTPPRTEGEPSVARRAPAVHTDHPGAEDHESYSADELAASAGATPELVNELKQYGLISVHAVVAGTPYFDQTALTVTRAAVGFARHGVEARHLRAWRNSADREAALFEQLIMPLLRQRNPQARRQAADTVADLSRLGGELREALLQRALRDIR
jgi:DNA-binding transcriptional MerR regulator